VRRRLAAMTATGDDDRGLTLVEVMVSAALTILVMAMVVGFFAQTAKITSTAVQSRTGNTIAGTAMQEITNVVRLGAQLPVQGSNVPSPPVVTATATKLVIVAFVSVTNTNDPAPTRVTFDSSSGSIVESRCVGTKQNGFWTFGSCASTSTQNLGGPVVAPDSTQNPLFTYLDANGAVLALSSGSLPATAIPNVATITISVKMQATGQTILAPVYLTANVTMPNTGLQKATAS
jgi:hypothetical protein